MCLLYQVFSTGQPSYIYDVLPPMRSSRWHVNSFNLASCTSEYFKNSFIPNAIYEWNKLDPDIERNGKTFSVSCGYVLGDKFSWELPFCKVRCFYFKKNLLIIVNKHWARSRKFVNNWFLRKVIEPKKHWSCRFFALYNWLYLYQKYLNFVD